jgi:transcriptional regulator with XRE-family HTH domain
MNLTQRQALSTDLAEKHSRHDNPFCSKQLQLMGLKAQVLLKRNIETLLKSRGKTQKELAFYCGATEPWLSQILKQDTRNFRMAYLDRIADFFGLATYQLFQPGLAHVTERRSGRDRRSGVDRRISRAVEMLRPAPSVAELESRMRQLSPEAYREFARRAEAALTEAEPRRAASAQPGPPGSAAPPAERVLRTRNVRRR